MTITNHSEYAENDRTKTPYTANLTAAILSLQKSMVNMYLEPHVAARFTIFKAAWLQVEMTYTQSLENTMKDTASGGFELMNTRDICEQLRVSPRTLERYRKRSSSDNPFPEPDCSCMGGSNKWLKKKVNDWLVKEMSRATRRPMSHLNIQRDAKGKIICSKA